MADVRNSAGSWYTSAGASSWRRYLSSAGSLSSVYTRAWSLRVTTMAPPTLRQPWLTPMPIGPSEATVAATAPLVSTSVPWICQVRPSCPAAPPPNSGTPAPTTPYAPRRMFSCERVYPSVSSMSTFACRSGTPSAQAATAAPASRWRPAIPSSAAVATASPAPPIAVTTTVPSPGPSGAISPLVEQPMTGTPGAAAATPCASATGS